MAAYNHSDTTCASAVAQVPLVLDNGCYAVTAVDSYKGAITSGAAGVVAGAAAGVAAMAAVVRLAMA
jgi:hypothetical protein